MCPTIVRCQADIHPGFGLEYLNGVFQTKREGMRRQRVSVYVVVSHPLFLTAAVGSEPGSDENEKVRKVIK